MKHQKRAAKAALKLCCRVEHVFDENAVAGGRIVNKDMSNGADELAVLDDRRAGHADVK